MRKISIRFLFLFISFLLASCSATKFVPEGQYLLDDVRIRTDNKSVKPSSLHIYLRQTPNSKWFSLIKSQLYLYNLSGRDSTQWANKVLRRIGDAPVIYHSEDAIRSQVEITKAVRNMGYMGATVKKSESKKKKKIKVYFDVTTGEPYVVRTLKRIIDDSAISQLLASDSLASLLTPGMVFDVNVLDAERQRIAESLLRRGYYEFNKDYIVYTADTIANTKQVDLTFHLQGYRAHVADSLGNHKRYRINNVSFIADYDVLKSSALSSIKVSDSIHYKGCPIYYNKKLYLRPKVLTDNLRIQSGGFYDAQDVQRTYANFGRLSALKYTNIRFFELQKTDSAALNCYVMLTRSKHKSIAFEVEGTNSAGDLGAAASVSLQNRNLFKGSEVFMVKFRGAYEVISGLQAGYRNNNYTEYAVESSINFPSFMFPFLSADYKRHIRATTEFGMQYNYQLRPEYSRTVASASWSYKWFQKQRVNHRIDLLDISFLYLPWISKQFEDDYINKGQNSIFQYNYRNRLIIRMGYGYTYNSQGAESVNNTIASNSYSIRVNFESAGNVMYALSRVLGLHQNNDGEYTVLGIPYAQYVKGEFDFAKNISIDSRNSLAFHLGLGTAIPYSNAKAIPFEKRYFAGGANSVRGWSVRRLGPGSFPGDGNQLNQSGDIKLDANIEYRSRLFWKFQSAVFVDAGNVWTIRSYANQPGGVFKFNQFYKQIAVAYGLGLRLDLGFFILRFDGGMKALNPVYDRGPERYPIWRPNFKRDFAFHFAVGYPF